MLANWPLYVFVATLAAAQPAAVIPAGRGSIAGQVLDFDTRQPVATVMLTLHSVKSRATLQTTSDADGRYIFEGVGPGDYRVSAAHDGYASEDWGVPDGVTLPSELLAQGWASFRLSDGQARTGLDFALQRAGSLAGRILKSDGEPAANALVRAARILDDHSVSPSLSTAVQSNPRGEYLLKDIRPGRYQVSAIWLDPDRARARAGAVTPSTYYPGTTLPDEAASVRVEAGRAASDINIRLAGYDLFRIAGHILRGHSEGGMEANLLSGAHTIRTVTVAADGSFELPHVKLGRHWLWARAATPDGYEAVITTIELATDLTGLVLPMLPTAAVSGRVVTGDGAVFTHAGFQVIAHLVDADGTKVDVLPRDRIDIDSDGRFTLTGLFGHRAFGLSGNEWDVERVFIGRTAVETLALESGERLDDVIVVVKKR